MWTPVDFANIANRAAIDKALSRLSQEGRIRRIGRGVYHYPETHPVLGEVAPSVDNIAKALAGRDQSRLLPSGAYAANLLRLSEQVPARIVFLTDGGARKVNIGNLTIELRHVSPKRVAAAGRTSGLVIEAIRYLGKENLTSERLKPLRKLLSARDRKLLLDDLRLAPAWVQPHLRMIAGKEEK